MMAFLCSVFGASLSRIRFEILVLFSCVLSAPVQKVCSTMCCDVACTPFTRCFS